MAYTALTYQATAWGFVGLNCTNESSIIDDSIRAYNFVFIGRITNLSWQNEIDSDVDRRTLSNYASGRLEARFTVLQVIKGGPVPFTDLIQQLYGNPDSNPAMTVAADYLVFTNDGEVYSDRRYGDPFGRQCVISLRRIPFNSDYDVAARIREAHPDFAR